MSAIKKLLEGQNDFINPVFSALTQRGETASIVWNKMEKAQRDAAMMVGGILIGIKVAIMQAAKLIEEMDLDDVI